MKVKDLILLLEEVEDKEQEVYWESTESGNLISIDMLVNRKTSEDDKPKLVVL